jgi:hypothetical protein
MVKPIQRDLIMDNITPMVPGTDSPCITLTSRQHTFYQQNTLKIRAPDGQHLETIGIEIQQENSRDIATQLLHQICLVQSLTSHVDERLELPQRAVYGLADLLYKMEEFCEKNIK